MMSTTTATRSDPDEPTVAWLLVPCLCRHESPGSDRETMAEAIRTMEARDD